MRPRPAFLPASLLFVAACSGADPSAPGVEGPSPRYVRLTAHGGAFFDHTCGLADDGAAYCWGDNAVGQLDSRRGADERAPIRAGGGAAFRQLATSWRHTCGITAAGPTLCWGDLAELNAPPTPPTIMAGGRAFASIAAGVPFTCGLTDEGEAWCWRSWERDASRVAPGLRFRALSIGSEATCGVTFEAEALCWGYAGFGQLGNGQQGDFHVEDPVRVAGGLRFSSIRVGAQHVCGVATDGSAHCWGSGSRGALGTGSLAPPSFRPTPVAGGIRFREVDAGSEHSCGLADDGAAWCWGENALGQLGDGGASGGRSLAPVRVSGGHRFQSLVASGAHACAADTEGVAWCWGLNSSGQLGDGSRPTGNPYGDIRRIPTRVASPVR